MGLKDRFAESYAKSKTMRGTSCPDQLANALKIYKEFVYNKNIYEGDDGY